MAEGSLGKRDGRFLRICFGQLIQEDHVQQRLMYLDTAVVAYKTELAKAIHEEADTGPSRSDHVGQRFLRNRRDESFRFAGLAEFSHQKQDAGQPFLAGVEELIDEVGLGAHAAGQQELEEYICECRLLMHYSNHFISADHERRTGVHGGSGCHTQPDDRGERLLPNKIPGGEESDGGLFAFLRNDGYPSSAFLQIKDRIRRVPLGKECLFGFQGDYDSAESGVGEKTGGVEWKVFVVRQDISSFRGKCAAVIPPECRQESSALFRKGLPGQSALRSSESTIKLCLSSRRWKAAVWSILLSHMRRTRCALRWPGLRGTRSCDDRHAGEMECLR